jgi:hypothetical protein
MFGKDEKGYVMSGLGFLLLIPVMIFIPLALSVEEQSTDIPNTYVKSDTVFQTLKNTLNDISDRTNDYKNKINKKTYDNPATFASDIYSLYNDTKKDNYESSFVGTVDSYSVSPNLTSSLSIGNETGVIPLKNGIEIKYFYINQTTINGKSVYEYNLNITANMIINIKKSNSGNNQNFYTAFTPVVFYLNSAVTNPNTFFTESLANDLKKYGMIYGC